MVNVLITGGSGYLGQFLVQALSAAGHAVSYTYSSVAAPVPGGAGFKVDLATGAGLDAVAAAAPKLDAVINCAAVSSPGVCEKDPGAARALNIPKELLAWMAGACPGALLVHLSTDQVYDGSRANWAEGDECKPVNVYGQSKVDAEKAIQHAWPNHVILRSSIIFGPEPPVPVARALFLQWMDGVLAKGEPMTFFEDEFRCPVYVEDIIGICKGLVAGSPQEYPHGERVFNMGGPERLSRVDMARAVAAARGHSEAAIQPVPSASVNRGVASPPDISMDVARVQRVLGVRMTPFPEAVKEIFSRL